MIPVVAIVGKSGSGKTILMEKLIAEFKHRGYRVAAIKHAHETVDLDTYGKDTWRFSSAGSDASVVCSPSRINIIKTSNDDPSIEDTINAIGNGYDIILAEGFKNSKVARIEVVARTTGAKMVCSESELSAVVTDRKIKVRVPCFGREDIAAIADFIEMEIVDKTPAGLSVTVNGSPVFLKPFVKDIIASSILGMLGTLKNVGIIRDAVISIRNKL